MLNKANNVFQYWELHLVPFSPNCAGLEIRPADFSKNYEFSGVSQASKGVGLGLVGTL